MEPSCQNEKKALKNLEEAPAASIEFIENLIGELSVTDDSNFDVNNDYRYMVANSIMNAKPGFSKSDGYALDLYLNQDSSQTIVFQGPMLLQPLVINNTALSALLEADTSLVAATPDINKNMLALLSSINIFNAKDILDKFLTIAEQHSWLTAPYFLIIFLFTFKILIFAWLE